MTEITNAYVLPLAEHEKHLFVLLGQERHHHQWSGFGGRKNKKSESPEETAARECWEESMGFLGNRGYIQKHLTDRLDLPDCHHSYFSLYIDYIPELPRIYRDTYDFLLHCGRRRLNKFCSEKVAIDWIDWSILRETILNGEHQCSFVNGNTCILDRHFSHDVSRVIQEFDS